MIALNQNVARGKEMLVNALLFQAVWVLAIFNVWPLMLVPLFAIVSHYFLTSDDYAEDFSIFFIVFLAGVFSDTFLFQLGVYHFPGHVAPPAVDAVSVASVFSAIKGGFAPDWLVVLWVAFATTINRSLTMFFNSPKVAIVLLTTIGPLAYLAGRACGAIEFSDANLIFIAVMWLGISCLCLFLFHCYEGEEDLEEWNEEMETIKYHHHGSYQYKDGAKDRARIESGYQTSRRKSFVRA